jgi:hypothetical protein
LLIQNQSIALLWDDLLRDTPLISLYKDERPFIKAFQGVSCAARGKLPFGVCQGLGGFTHTHPTWIILLGRQFVDRLRPKLIL